MSEIRTNQESQPEQQPISENPEAQIETELSPEVVEKIMAKVIDIYTEPEIKFRDAGWAGGIKSVIERGVAGEVSQRSIPKEVLYAKPPRSLFQYRPQIREVKAIVRGESHKTRKQAEAEQRVNDVYHYGYKGNVYYPDGLVSYFEHQAILQEENPKGYYKEESGHIAISQFGREMPESLLKKLSKRKIGARYYTDLIDLARKGQKERKKVLSLMPDIRNSIVEQFFEDAEVLEPETFQSLYPMHAGVVFDKNVDVKWIYSDDYPSQAAISGLRVSPRHIIGIYYNDNWRHEVLTKVIGKDKWGNDEHEHVSGKDILKTKLKDLWLFNIPGSKFDADVLNLTVEEYLFYLGRQYNLPVYNLRGELMWPRQLNHGEVKKFVTERDAENKSQEK